MTQSSSRAACPSCAAPVEGGGRFCGQCGAPVDGATCAGCRATLSPGARYCHRCGTAAGATAPAAAAGVRTARPNAMPWAFAAIVLLSFGAYVAAQQFQARRAPSALAPAGPAQPGAAPPGAVPAPDGAFPRAPDISQLTPEEAADRLFNRIMTEYEAGNSEFVQNMAPMALAAYERIPVLDALRRYDLGRIAEITGALGLARAQADTILADEPAHLLGLILAARVAELERDEARRAAYARRLIAAAPAELERDRIEYVAHRNDINIALTEARRRQR